MTHLPDGVVDCHVHVFEPDRFPYAADRDYTPGRADLVALEAFERSLGVSRFVLVQPSVYGTDNTALLDGLAQLGDAARAVAVIDETTGEDELAGLVDAGVVGLRLNAHADPAALGTDLRAPFSALLARAERHNLFVEVYADLTTLTGIADLIVASPVRVVLDHFGGIKTGPEGALKGVECVTKVLAAEQVWVKMSAGYRVFGDGVAIEGERCPDRIEELSAAISRYAEVAADRLVWASDWPHTGGGPARAARDPHTTEPFRIVDVAAELRSLLSVLGPDQSTRTLVTNPAKLFGFPTLPCA